MCGSKNSAESKCDAEIKEAWNHCQKWSKSVEVIYENEDDQKVLAKVHFRSYPSVSNISEKQCKVVALL